MTNLYKSFHHCIEPPKFYRSTEVYHEESSSALTRLSKPIDEPIPKLLQNVSVDEAERSSSIGTMRETTKESAVSGSGSSMHSLQEFPPVGSIKQSSTEAVSGVNLLKEADPALNTTNRAIRSYSDDEDDDGSIASRVLSLTSKCKSSSSIFGWSSRSENTPEKVPKIRGVKFEYCTEGLGSESSHWSISSRDGNVGRNEISDNGKGRKLGDVEDDCNLSICAGEEKENLAPKTNWACVSSERSKASKCIAKFPPPLSTLTRTRCPPHLPTAPLVFLRPLKMDGRFVLQEVRAPCRDFLRASRKDGRLRLEIVRDIDEANSGQSPCKSWQESEVEEEEKANVEEEEVVEDSGSSTSVENTDVKIEAKKREMKDGICISMSDNNNNNNSEEMKCIGQEVCFPKWERIIDEETKGMTQEAMVFDEIRNSGSDLQMKLWCLGNLFSSVGSDQNLPKISGSLPAHKVERSMAKTQQDFGRSLLCDTHQLLKVEDKEHQIFPPDHVHHQQTKYRQEGALQQELCKTREECCSRLAVMEATKSSISKMFASISSDTRNDLWCGQAKEQGGIANLSAAAKGGVNDACTSFSRAHSMPVLSPFPTPLSSALPDLQLSLTQMQAAIISNSEALHISCKKGLDGNNWKKGVSPFVGVPLRC